LYAKQPTEDHRGPTPDKTPIELKGNSIEQNFLRENKTYKVINGIAAQTAEQILVATGGGASIPRVMALLCTRSKYSPVATHTAAATAVVNTQPPARTIPRHPKPMSSPKTILFFSCPFC
jgi:hypothetical protein